jgi:hypothetical protein
VRRTLLVPLGLVALLVLPAPQANAGGSWMEPGRRGYGVGETATFRGSFSMSGSLEGTLSDGPYVAYLAPIQIYDVDHARAVRLGEIRMVRGGRWGMIARVSFTVPDVPTGRYHLTYCNEPCTVDGIGDLVGGGSFFVAPTRDEALLRSRVERLTWRVANARQEGRAKERRASERLERSLAESTRELEAARARIATLERGLAELGSEPAPAAQPQAPLVPGWALVVVALAATAGLVAVVLGRRRRGAMWIVPDTIPDELEEREPALRP